MHIKESDDNMLFGIGSNSRNIFLNGEINTESAGQVIQRLMEISEEDEEAIATKVGYQPEPIILYINSVGGTVYDGRAIMAAIETIETPVYTVALGACMSMALAVLLAGEIRYASRHAILMYHGVWGGNWGSVVEQESNLNHTKQLQKEYDEYVMERTDGCVTQEDLDAVKDDKENWYMTPKVAKSKAFIHAILPMNEKEWNEFMKKLTGGVLGGKEE